MTRDRVDHRQVVGRQRREKMRDRLIETALLARAIFPPSDGLIARSAAALRR